MRKSQPKDRPAATRYAHARSGSAPDSNEPASLMPDPAFSRRTFISATAIVGALNFLGSIVTPSGTVIAAYADEDDNAHFSIYVLSREEVPVMALRKTDKGNVAVEGVKVTITSLYNQKTLTVTTGKDGFAAARIRELSFECDDETAAQFSFYGDVVAKADGYRELHFTEELIQAGVPTAQDGSRSNTIEIPMEVDDGTMYLRSVSLDDVDVLHSTVPAYVGDYSTEDHALSLELMLPNKSAASKARITLLVDDTEWTSTTASATANDQFLVNASFTDTFLSKLKQGQTMKLRLEVDGQQTKTATLPLTFRNALVLAGGSTGTSLSAGLTPTPADMSDKRPGFRAVAWLFGENDTMYLGFPGLPFQFFDDAAGNFGFSVTISGINLYKSVNGEDKTPELQFRKYNGKAGWAAFDNWKNTAQESYKTFTDTMDRAAGNLSKCGVSKFSSMITANFEINGMAYGKSAYIDEETWQGDTKGTFDIAFAATFSINANFGCQAWILAFPFYVDIDFSLTVMARLAFGISFKNFFEDWAWGHHYVDGCPLQFVFFTNVQGGLSVGFGIRGLLGAAVRGNASVVAQHIYDIAEGKPMPHGLLKITLGVQIVIQILVYTKSFNMIDPKTLGPWEAWGFSSSSNLEDTPLPWNLDNIDLSDAKLPSQETLANVSEYSATLNVDVDTASASDADGTGDDEEGTADKGFSTLMPETYKRSRDLLGANAPKNLIAAGPKSAAGFASPYGALNATGKLKLGATGTSDLAATGTQADFASVATYNPHLGLIPTEQEVLYDNVYSNTRLRTFVGNSAYTDDPERYTVMARLVTVTIPDNSGKTWTRTRVCVRPWDADKRAFGKEQTISFNVNGLSSINRHDVDFDIDCIEYKGELLLVMGITSISMEGDEDLPFEQAQDRQFLTFLVWNATTNRLNWASTRYYLLSQGFSTFHPRVLVQGNPKESDLANSHRCCFYHFKKNLNSKEQKNGIFIAAHSLTGDQITPNEGIDLNIDKGSSSHLPVDGVFLLDGTFEVASSDRTELTNLDSQRNLVHTVLFWHGGKYGSSFVRSFRSNADSVFCDSQIIPDKVASFSRRGSEDSQSLFTYTTTSKMPSEKKNHVIKYDVDAHQLTDIELSAYSIDAHTTASHNGKRLYTVRLAEGTSNKLDDAALAALDAGALLSSSSHYVAATGANYGGAATDSDVCEPVYQLLESRWIESLGAYHEFYPIARLAFPPDTTSILSSDNGQRDFVMTSITDADQVISDVYHVAVPDVLAIQCEGVYPDSPYAGAGDTVGYYVKVTNIGNTLVTGFTITLRDEDGNEMSAQDCHDLRPHLQESQNNYHVVRDRNDEPTYNEDGSMASEFAEDIRDTSGILWPGFTRTFLFSFTMPDGYEGEVTFNVQVSDPRSNPYINELSKDAVFQQSNVAATVADHLSWLDASDFAEALFGASVQTIVDPRRHALKLENKTVSENLINGFSAVPAVYTTEGDTDSDDTDDSDTPSNKGNENSEGTGKKQPTSEMPRTGDGAGVAAGVVAAAAVVAGAAGAIGLAADTDEDAS